MEKNNKSKKPSRGDNAVLEVKETPAKPEKSAAQVKAENSGGTSLPLPDPETRNPPAEGQKHRKALLPPWFVIDK